MTKYHINKKGVPAICRAKSGNCPLGDDNEHFSTPEEAQIYIDKENERKHGILPGINNGPEESNDKQTQLLAKKNELINSIEGLKGLNKIRAKKELRRIEYALEGRDYDEEMRLEEEIRQARIDEQNKKDLESKANAEMLANKETLELPKSIEQHIVNGTWSRNKVSAYRGEQNDRAEVNTGLAIYGQGRYTTTDRSYAKKFGNVRKAELDELPVLPLRLKTIGGFQLLEQEVARNHNINYRDLYTKMDVSDMIVKMGYDGLTLGTGKDMIIVKYI